MAHAHSLAAHAHEMPFTAMSIMVAVLGSWTALDLLRRATANTGAARWWWLAGAASGLGLSIWAMHFVAMLGWSPGVPILYDPGLTALSLALPILACATAFVLATGGRLGRLQRPLTAVAVGAAICAMHYVGMSAVRGGVRLSFDPGLVVVSYLVAVAAAYGALWAASRQVRRWSHLGAAAALGLGIVSMHYTGMAALRVSLDPEAAVSVGIDRLPLAMFVGAGTLWLLLLGVIAAVVDRRFEVVAEREAAAAARRSERFLRDVVDHLPMGVIVAEAPSGRLRHVNAEAERLMRQAPAGIDSWRDYTAFSGRHPDGRPYAPEDYPLAQAVRGERVERRRLPYARGDGETCVFEVSAAPVLDEDGVARFAVAAFSDVTDQLRAEETLRQAQRLEAVGQLTSGIAHDFNNLLTAVTGSLSILARRLEDPHALRLVDTAMQGAQRGAALTAQLLAFSRRQRIAAEPVDVHARLEGMRGLLSRTLGGTIEVVMRLDPDAPHALADPTQLELAILNLAINARDAMPNGGTLTIATGRETSTRRASVNEPGPGHYLCVSVEDTGAGIPDSVLPHIFEPFFTTKPVGKGSGLGLSQLLGLTQQMGGGVRVRTRPGHGSCFTLLLPATEAPQPAAEPAPAPSSGCTPEGGCRVLVVDDDRDVCAYMHGVLDEAGFEVRAAPGGEEAVARLSDGWRPDVVVIDYAMPGLNGVDAAERLRRAGGRDARFLFVTGYADFAALEGAEVLHKPFRPEDLLARVDRLGRADAAVPA